MKDVKYLDFSPIDRLLDRALLDITSSCKVMIDFPDVSFGKVSSKWQFLGKDRDLSKIKNFGKIGIQ